MGGLGAILRKVNGFIFWNSNGPALSETQMKAKGCGSMKQELKSSFGPTVEFYRL